MKDELDNLAFQNDKSILNPLQERVDKLTSILDQIQSDLSDLQNNPDESWASQIRELNAPLGIFYERICASVTDYESLTQNLFDRETEFPVEDFEL